MLHLALYRLYSLFICIELTKASFYSPTIRYTLMVNPVLSSFAQTSNFETAANAAEVTPSDVLTLSVPCACLRIGLGGTVRVRHAGNEADITYQTTDGEVLRVKADRVFATGTTATDIVAWW